MEMIFSDDPLYQERRKKILKSSIVILIFGLIVGFGFIGLGAIVQNDVYRRNFITERKAIEETNKNIENANNEIKALDKKISKSEKAIIEINNKKKSSSSVEEKAKYDSELSKLQSDIEKYKNDKAKIATSDKNVYYNLIPNLIFILFYFLGTILICVCGMISIVYYSIKKGKLDKKFKSAELSSLIDDEIL